MLDLVNYAKQKRYRVRNLHDGQPVPPARDMRSRGSRGTAVGGHRGRDAHWAVVGYNGYLDSDGRTIGMYLSLRSPRGVRSALRRVALLGGDVIQEGDGEIFARFPADALESLTKLIKVYKLRPGNRASLPLMPTPARSGR